VREAYGRNAIIRRVEGRKPQPFAKLVGDAVPALEDRLTEFFAAVLAACPPVRDEYARMVLAAHAQEHGWSPPIIDDVLVQATWKEQGARPDMVVLLADGKLIACEHKIFAAETSGRGQPTQPKPSPDDAEASVQGPKGQLSRYMTLPGVSAVIYVRVLPSRIDDEVRDDRHGRYIRPELGDHFLWSDFYPLVQAACDEFAPARWLIEAFDELRIRPLRDEIGKLVISASDSDEVVQQKKDNQSNFYGYWSQTTSLARELGWRWHPGSRMQLYLKGNPKARASHVLLDPATKRGEFRIRVTPREGHYDQVRADLSAAASSVQPHPKAITTRPVARAVGRVPVIDYVVDDYLKVVGDVSKKEIYQERLKAFVGPFLESLQET
jgi:hypothetical protein